jgi:hypothetical protein
MAEAPASRGRVVRRLAQRRENAPRPRSTCVGSEVMDEQAVTDLVGEVEQAWNTHDMARFAACFAEERGLRQCPRLVVEGA